MNLLCRWKTVFTLKDRDNAQLEVNALLQEIDKIANNTRFNGVKVLDGSYDQSIRAGNTNAETIRVSVDGLKTLDLPKSLVLRRILQLSAATSVTSTGADTDIKVTMGITKASTVEIDTSIFSTDFKEAFKSDSLGTFQSIRRRCSKLLD